MSSHPYDLPPRRPPAEVERPARIEHDTEERLRLAVPFVDLVEMLTTDLHFDRDYADAWLVDWPDAWHLTRIETGGEETTDPWAVLTFERHDHRTRGGQI